MTTAGFGEAKRRLRAEVWSGLVSSGVAQAPDGGCLEVPPFAGAATAASRAAGLEAFRRARVLLCDGDAAQDPLRREALRQGKTVYMAVPGLAALECFVELEPRRLAGRVDAAATADGALSLGRRVGLDEMRTIDLVVCGAVAVDRRGGRLGPGGGASDLEFAILAASGKVVSSTMVLATVHGRQVLDSELPMERHDVPLDLIVTPDEVMRCRRQPRPTGVYWDWLPDETLAAVPVLQRMAPKRTSFIHTGGDPDWDLYRS